MLRTIVLGLLLALGRSAAAAQEQAEEAPVLVEPTVTGEVALGWQGIDVDGSRPRFGQYLLPPEEVYLARLRLTSLDEHAQPVLQVWAEDLGEDFHRGQIIAPEGSHHYSFHYDFARARFYPEPNARPTPRVGHRTENLLRFNWTPPGGAFGQFNFQHLRLAAPGLTREGELAYRTDNLGYRAVWPLGQGELDLRYSHLRFVDATSRQPDSVTRTYTAEYAVDLGRTTTLAATYASSRIEQDRAPDSQVRLWRLSGAYAPRPEWDALVRYERRDIDLGVTQNAYTRESSAGLMMLTYRPWPSLTARLNYERRDLERLNARQDFVDNPRWQTLRLSAEWKGPQNERVKGIYERRALSRKPLASLPQTGDPRPLMPDEDRRLELKATYPFQVEGFAYALYRDRRRENDSRGVAYSLRTTGLGGFYQVQPNLTAEVTFTQDDWRSPSAVLAGSLSDVKVTTLGLNYLPVERAWVTLNYVRARSDEASLVEEDQWSLSGSYELPPGGEVTLSYHNSDYEYANFPGLNYDARRWQVSYSTPF